MPPKLLQLLTVALGAASGAILRHEAYLLVSHFGLNAYYATMVVNVVGSFCIGVLFVTFSLLQHSFLQLLLVTGLLGSFTTFSTFSLDVIKLFDQGAYLQGGYLVVGQLILGFGFCFLGIRMASLFLK